MSIRSTAVSVTTVFMVLVLALLCSSCGGSNVTQNLSAEDRFAEGKKKFDDHDYLEAINDFDIIKLQFPGSGVADKAQFYLAECRFAREEFLVAAEEFRGLRRNMPASPLVPEAMYKTALCYYRLSPKSSLDQDYTVRAIDEFQNFIEYNPKDTLVKDAETKIIELNTRLAQKLYDTGRLYLTLEYYRSAAIYFGSVIEKYHDTPYAEPALIGRARANIARKQYEEARQDIMKFLEKYPNSPMRSEAESLRNELNDKGKGSSSDADSRFRLNGVHPFPKGLQTA